MIGVVARQEFRSCVRDGRVRAGALLLLLLGVLALASAAARYAQLSSERAVAQALIEEQWTLQGEKNPHSAAHYGLYAFRPALPLGFFDPGVQAFEGVSIWLEAHKRNFANGRPADDMTALGRFGELSLAFVFQALMPLALILLGYGAFAREREVGTLRQVLSTGVSAAQVFVGKFLGLGAAFLLLSAPLLLGALVLLVAATGTQWLGAAALLVLVHLLYAALVLTLVLIVSARASTAQNALLMLLGFWALTTFMLPRLAADAGRIAAPTPAASQIVAAIDEDLATGIDGVSPAMRVEQRREALLKLYKVDRIEDLPINFQGIVFEIQDEIGNAVYDRHFGRFATAVDAQVDVVEAASLLSPRLAVSLVSQELAGTSLAHQRHFEADAERFRRTVMEALNRDITFNSRPGQLDYRAGAELWRRTGGYSYSPQPLSASLARSAGPLTALVLWSAVVFGLAIVTLRRLRVLAA